MLVWGRCCGSSRQWLDQFAWAWKDISTLTWITETFHILRTIHQDSLADSLGFTKLFNEVVSGHSVVIPCRNNRPFCLQESKRPFHSMWYWSCKSFKWHLLSHSAFCSLRFEDLKKLRRMTGLKPMLRCFMFYHVLEELFDFKLWESARGIEGKPSPHVSQPNAFVFALRFFQFWAPGLAGRVSETSDAVYRSRERQLDCTQVQRAESCVLPKKNVNILSFCNIILYFCIFVVCWYDFPSRQKQYCSSSVMPRWIT